MKYLYSQVRLRRFLSNHHTQKFYEITSVLQILSQLESFVLFTMLQYLISRIPKFRIEFCNVNLEDVLACSVMQILSEYLTSPMIYQMQKMF